MSATSLQVFTYTVQINTNMKITFVSFQSYPLFNQKQPGAFGGAELQLSIIAKQLSKIGYDVDILTASYNNHETEIIEKIKIIKLGNLSPKILNQIKFISKFIYELLISESNVFIQRSAGVETGIIAIISRILNKKFIYMSASTIDVDGKYKKLHPIRGIFYNLGISLANTIVVQNNEQKKLLKKTYKKSAVIIKNSYVIKKQPRTKKSYILWVGSSQKLKQPQIFLDIASNFPDEKFVMIMPNNDHQLWEKINGQSKFLTNLKIISQVPFLEIQNYFNKAKLLINTSSYEGFPNTFIEAGLAKIPIVSLTVNPDNYLNRYICGYSFHNKFKNMLIGINELINNPKLCLELGKNNFNYVCKNHDINKNIYKLEKILK